ncbi:hypothetical protein TIFTF001_033984 [Ficus carica]|uniref:Uncharacterized protein n=1 Tax=Ficus carica TaxID=3494 RepID=A0AA88E2Y3_FICCA|nr:hypothetical protein TIFTF001_033984 [Ficus carica]
MISEPRSGSSFGIGVGNGLRNQRWGWVFVQGLGLVFMMGLGSDFGTRSGSDFTIEIGTGTDYNP